ncbi:glutaredoxin family protein [Teredinibacter sp. KSP-S5-2]|uniref:glutaredoxin family protein n=1 Tax=Teredinibacter sp. KSP-S5-2 TaxID=3034506 RepID=UPI0029352485|nr:glutaredoxin family protein [Teredinibacter sp. KSP-S5-2]WNO11212.1 glutaredoxin family protein [Teredinibacter sp. KSP-S5-2]
MSPAIPMRKMILYTTDGCHLCDLAIEAVEQSCIAIDLIEVDITSDKQLVELYGIRIPVIKDRQTGKEIGWPFNDVSFSQWYESLANSRG